MLESVDTFLAAVPWTDRRTVVVYLREHGARRYVRLRTFNKHREKGCWYPAPRFYMVPIESAETLGRAIIAASKGQSFGPPPDWWTDFEKQYQKYQAGNDAAQEASNPERPDTPAVRPGESGQGGGCVRPSERR